MKKPEEHDGPEHLYFILVDAGRADDEPLYLSDDACDVRYSQVLGAISMVSLVGILVLFLVKLPNAGAAHLAVSLLSAALTIGLVGNESSLTSRVLSWRPFVDVGVVSYGIYLWHLPVRA